MSPLNYGEGPYVRNLQAWGEKRDNHVCEWLHLKWYNFIKKTFTGLKLSLNKCLGLSRSPKCGLQLSLFYLFIKYFFAKFCTYFIVLFTKQK